VSRSRSVKERKTTHADAWRGFDRSERVIAYPLAFPVLATHRWVRRGVVMLDRGDVGRFIETLRARIVVLRERDDELAARLIAVLEEVIEDLERGRVP
jgi:hypothetical protein